MDRNNKHRSSGKPSLEGVESSLSFWRPGEGGLGGHESIEGGSYMAVVLNKTSVNIGKTQKALELPTGCGPGPLSHSLCPHLTPVQ